jgi:hypothetical protein
MGISKDWRLMKKGRIFISLIFPVLGGFLGALGDSAVAFHHPHSIHNSEIND